MRLADDLVECTRPHAFSERRSPLHELFATLREKVIAGHLLPL
jgi:hypothetical protein